LRLLTQFPKLILPQGTSDVQIVASTSPPITLSTDSSTTCMLEDDPNWYSFHGIPIQNSVVDESEEEEFSEMLPPTKRTKKN
jgi:hypothetical protein